MKKILITGSKGYIGRNLKEMFESFPKKYSVNNINLRNEAWLNENFSEYDVVIHLAAIVHKKENENKYYEINKNLAVRVAEKTKMSGVKQFIFMSTMAVYGEEGKINKKVTINKETIPQPKSYYGKSKLAAEFEINKLGNENFRVSIIRPPMIYGENCPGNYAKLEKLAQISPIFPMVKNVRSVLHIDNLCEHIKFIIDTNGNGLFLPQDHQYINTSLWVKSIAEKNNSKIHLSKLIGLLVKLTGKKSKILNKIFGNLVYEKQ